LPKIQTLPLGKSLRLASALRRLEYSALVTEIPKAWFGQKLANCCRRSMVRKGETSLILLLKDPTMAGRTLRLVRIMAPMGGKMTPLLGSISASRHHYLPGFHLSLSQT